MWLASILGSLQEVLIQSLLPLDDQGNLLQGPKPRQSPPWKVAAVTREREKKGKTKIIGRSEEFHHGITHGIPPLDLDI